MADHTEYLITLRVRTADPVAPDKWDWQGLHGGQITVESAQRTGQLFVVDPEKGLVPVDYTKEPTRLLGQFVTVSWYNGRGIITDSGTLQMVNDNHLQVQDGTLGASRTIPLEMVRSLVPSTPAQRSRR